MIFVICFWILGDSTLMTERALNRHVLRYFPLIISPFMLSNKVSALIATCSKVRPNKSPGTNQI